MKRDQQVKLLKRGVEQWNRWRSSNPNVNIDLRRAHLGDVKLPGVDLRHANLGGVRLRWAYMREAQLAGASLEKADLRIADLSKADLRGANLRGAQLQGAYLRQANLEGANLEGANLLGINLDQANLRDATLAGSNLRNAVLVDVDLSGANISGCRVYGASVWNTDTTKALQNDLVITQESESDIAVDNLDVAQFIYLLLNNEKLRDVLDTVTSKVVLILGRFTAERKPILDSVRDALRHANPPYVPVVFDFEKPAGRDFIETVSTLAHMARFVVADITSPRIVIEEIPHIVRNLAVPVQPIVERGSGDEPVTLYNLRRNHRTLLPTVEYDRSDLLASLEHDVIGPAEAMALELLKS
jgi:hypothetical protein